MSSISEFKRRVNSQGLITYVQNFEAYNQPAMINGQCNSMTYVNQGTSTAFINGVLRLDPGQSFTLDGNEGEWDNGNYQITFQTGVGADYNYLVVIRKVFQ